MILPFNKIKDLENKIREKCFKVNLYYILYESVFIFVCVKIEEKKTATTKINKKNEKEK